MALRWKFKFQHSLKHRHQRIVHKINQLDTTVITLRYWFSVVYQQNPVQWISYTPIRVVSSILMTRQPSIWLRRLTKKTFQSYTMWFNVVHIDDTREREEPRTQCLIPILHKKHSEVKRTQISQKDPQRQREAS